MSVEVTVLGGTRTTEVKNPTDGSPDSECHIIPTTIGRWGGIRSGGVSPTITLPPASHFAPSVLSPTSMRMVVPVGSTRSSASTMPAQSTSGDHKLTASSLPGKRICTLNVDTEQLRCRFPGITLEMIQRVQGILLGIFPESMDSSACLSFGTQSQDRVTQLVKKRLASMELSEASHVTQHLSKLLSRFGDVLGAMRGGLFKRSPTKVWCSVVDEVRQLELLLTDSYPNLITTINQLDSLVKDNVETNLELNAWSLSAEYLVDIVINSGSPRMDQIGGLLISRAASLKTSQALVLAQIQMLELDKLKIQELTTLVQDGVLLQLPEIYSLLASLSGKINETQRFTIKEKLTDIVQRLKT